MNISLSKQEITVDLLLQNYEMTFYIESDEK